MPRASKMNTIKKTSWQDRRPAWIKEGVIEAGKWEGLTHRVRGGWLRANEAEIFRKEHSPETIRKLAAMGVTLVVTQFHKGFGLKAERDDIALAKQLVEICHRQHIKVGGYIRTDNVILETMLDEEPAASDWLRIDQDGQTPGYTYYRKYVCLNHPGYEKYLKKVIAYGIEKVGFDLFHLDGFTSGLEGRSCHCPRCRNLFQEFLAKKYGRDPALAKSRFGFSNVKRLLPPDVMPHRPLDSPGMQFIRDPLWQEWIEFRCASLAGFHDRLSAYIHELDPDVAISINSALATYMNSAFAVGCQPTKLARGNDFMWTEQLSEAGVQPNGALVTKIREFKIARSLKNMVMAYQYRCASADQVKLSMCQAMAYNQQTLGELGGACGVFLDQLPFFKEKKHCVDFFRRNKAFFRDTKTLANVAVLRSYPSMAYDCVDAYRSALLFEQVLIQAKIPFDIIFDAQLTDLSKYTALVVANMRCLAEAQISSIREYVRQGGGLVATEETSAYDAWARERPDFGMADVFGTHRAPVNMDLKWLFDNLGIIIAEDGLVSQQHDKMTKNTFGRGRSVYLPRIIPSLDIPVTGAVCAIPPSCLALPKNYKEMIEAVIWASKDTIPLKVKAPLAVTVELLRQKRAKRIVLHLLNYDPNTCAKDIDVELRLPSGKRAKAMQRLDIDAADIRKVAFRQKADLVSFKIDKLSIYSMIVIEMED